MWTTHVHDSVRPGGVRVALRNGTDFAVYAEVMEAWRADEQFRSWFSAVLAGIPFRAFRWETPPVSTRTATQPFEFVALDSPGLLSPPDPEAFEEHFRDRPEPVVTFPNLGGDAIMVVPCPVGPTSAYAHLAAFVRGAPDTQRSALWRAVGDAMVARLGAKPVWLSTAGGGVSWLHVRLDDQPKYYGFEPYRHAK
jgi:hypothetical protein